MKRILHMLYGEFLSITSDLVRNNTIRQTDRRITLLLLFCAILSTSCDEKIAPNTHIGSDIDIYPDYKGVTIPCNIAPMNFNVLEEGDFALLIKGEEQTITVKARKGHFDIPAKKWREVLNSNMGKQLEFTIISKEGAQWHAYNPFTMNVASEPIDSHLAYRLIVPGEQWHHMGIYQRDLTTFEQSPIYENHLTNYNCVNCHTFHSRNPEKMIFHMRAKEANGTALIEKGKVRKVNTKTDEMLSNLVYSYWHPEGRYLVASTNTIYQSYFYHSADRMEVYDVASDVVVWDTENNVIIDNKIIASPDKMETFPTFSPDGRRLYYCVAENVENIHKNIDKLRYSLCAVDFDPETGRTGTEIDTLFNAQKEGGSISMPRISPDGQHLVVNIMKWGNFSTYHSDSDLYTIDIETGELRAIDTINSNESEGSHSWSSNSRWMVFSSRREDKLFTQPHFTYIDKNGTFHKPFVLPQRNPLQFYRDNFYAFNLPELISGKVNVNPRDIATEMATDGIDLRYEK